MDLTELDSLRAVKMAELLNEEGQKHIWKYDVVNAKLAAGMAIADQNYDNMETAQKEFYKGGKQYALIGPGICDHYFSTEAELVELIKWLCLEGYLSCYKKS